MINTVIWGLESDISKYALTMLEQEGRISIKAWFGEKDKASVVTHHCFDWEKGNFDEKDFFGCPSPIYKAVYKHIYTFLDMNSRNFKYDHFRLHDGLNIFNMLIDLFYEIFKKHNIDLVIFANMPHLGPDYVLYCLAKAMNIQTLIVTQSLFPNQFFFVYDMEDFGFFEKIPVFSHELAAFNLPKQFKKDLFYMQDKKQDASFVQKPRERLNLSGWIERRRSVWHKSLKKYVDFTDMCLSKMTGKLIKKKMKAAYKKQATSHYASQVDLNAKFVYFPLHLQPEMTTSALGGMYCDQILAIERLVSWLPEDWLVYVKENPKQNELMRGQYFFKRLQRIPRVKLISGSYNTYDLIENCQFVATITGTAGWEAISGGKNTVIFGKAWYQKLPGVFIYSSGLSVESVIRFKIDHKKLQNELALLMRKMVPGVVDEVYVQIVDNFDKQANNYQLLEFFRYILDQNFSQKREGIIENV